MDYDLKIVDGVIVDGLGNPRYRGDVAVRNGVVAALGKAGGSARQTIQAEGCVIAPGFIDIHTHYDAQIMWEPLSSSGSKMSCILQICVLRLHIRHLDSSNPIPIPKRSIH